MSHNRINSSTNRALDAAAHAANLLQPDEHAETSALIPRHQQVLQKDTHTLANALELARDVALDRAAEHCAAAAIASPLVFGYQSLKNLHEDWQRGQDAKGAAFNDVCSFAVTSALDFPAGFKTEDHARRPGVEKAGLKLTEELMKRPADRRAMQQSADSGFLDAERAWAAVKTLPVGQRAAAMITQLTQSGKAVKLEGDLAYGKGVESFLYTQAHPEIADAEAAKVHARAGSALDFRPPVRG